MFIRKKKILRILQALENDALAQQKQSANQRNHDWWHGRETAYADLQKQIKR